MTLFRGRRLRQSEALRGLVRETAVQVSHLVQPFFVIPGQGRREPIESMPGQFRWTVDLLVEEALRLYQLGVRAVLLFGISERKDAMGSEAWSPDGAVQRACVELKSVLPDMCVMTDVCMCEYTSHGHCGALDGRGCVDNEATLELLARAALSHARAGADVVAPSDMMDGRVAAIRAALDLEGFLQTPIMSYAVKYASAFYGPFRDAAGSAPAFGDRRSYQMDCGNLREARREMSADIAEGADILMVKPGLAYLDVLAEARRLTNLPLAVYNVSGEYAMVKAAAERGWLDERRIVMETMTAFRRAGADIVITYHAADLAEWLG